MNNILAAIAGIIIFIFILLFLFRRKKKNREAVALSAEEQDILAQHVEFYQKLEQAKKKIFEFRVVKFLQRTKLTGVNTVVETLDKMLIAAGAIIPIFNFDDWEYLNLREVLLYPDSFSEAFSQAGSERNIGGMVGTGALNHVMILSKIQLREGFKYEQGNTNTAIHEFVHLVDKTDGAIDGLPEFLLNKKYLLPWLSLIQQEMEKIRDDKSDIRLYALTNQAEFFAVVSEYFFERPELFAEKHPELYKMMLKIFRKNEAEKPL
ncbi:MAG: M90 family metallopeptidase [Ferruginibacter sp.]